MKIYKLNEKIRDLRKDIKKAEYPLSYKPLSGFVSLLTGLTFGIVTAADCLGKCDDLMPRGLKIGFGVASLALTALGGGLLTLNEEAIFR